MAKKKRFLPVPDEIPRRESRFPRGRTIFTWPTDGPKWFYSVGAGNSSRAEQMEIGWVSRYGTRHGSRFVAKSPFWKYRLDHFTSLAEAKEWLVEMYNEERIRDSTRWAPGGLVRDVRFGRSWNKKGVDRFNPS